MQFIIATIVIYLAVIHYHHLSPSPIIITYHYHQRATARICRRQRWVMAMDDIDGPRYFGQNSYAVESPFQSIHR